MAITITDTQTFKGLSGKMRIGNYAITGAEIVRIPISKNDIVFAVTATSSNADLFNVTKPVVDETFPFTNKSEIKLIPEEDDEGTFEIYFK